MVVAMEGVVTSRYPDNNCCKATEEHNASTYKLEVQGMHKLANSALCSLIFYPEEGGSVFLCNAVILHIVYRMSYTKRQYSLCLEYIENHYFIKFPGVLLPSREIMSRSCREIPAVEGRTWPPRPAAEPP